MIYGIFGFPLTHSFSQEIFQKLFIKEGKNNFKYKVFSASEHHHFIKIIETEPLLAGLNITIPHKKNICQYLNESDDIVQKTGSVNNVVVERRDGCIFLKGYNTDVYGFSQSIKPFLASHHSTALILGNGGASASVQLVLKQIGIDYNIITRNCVLPNHFDWTQLNENMISFHKLIINTTPLGMFPNVDVYPEIPYQAISSEHFACDLIYNPEKTQFLKKAESNGAMILNGWAMLQFQAEKSWEIWKRNA